MSVIVGAILVGVVITVIVVGPSIGAGGGVGLAPTGATLQERFARSNRLRREELRRKEHRG